MQAKENQVYRAAMVFRKNCDALKSAADQDIKPETVLYCYAKLLSMDEALLRNFVPEECMDDIEAAHKWFEDTKLDLELIKSGLVLLIPIIPDKESSDKRKVFNAYLDADKSKTGSQDILSNALENAFIKMTEVFVRGKELQDVFECMDELKEKYKESGENNEASDPDTGIEENTGASAKKEVSNEEGIGHKEEGREAAKAKTDNTKNEKRSLLESAQKDRELKRALLDVVKGQDRAVLKFVKGYSQGELLKNTERGNHPRSFFFFFGPPGVGKTLLATTAANSLGLPYKIFDMSGYSGHQSHEELIGVADMYSKTKEGTLVEFVRTNPECLLVFDEIEKAHINVIRLFLQILGSGSLRNPHKNKETSFRDAVIIFTSNVGRELYADKSVDLASIPDKVLIDAIQKEKDPYGEPALPPEICSRIASGNTILFNHLPVRYLADMVRDSFDKITKGMENEYGVRITYAKELPLLFLYNRGDEIDARVASGQSGIFLKDEISELLQQMLQRKKPGSSDMKSIKIEVDWKKMDPELTVLFKNKECTEVLVISDDEEFFNSLNSKQYKIHLASTVEETREALQNEISAVFIDPYYGVKDTDKTIMSISDYNTEGIAVFRKMVQKQAGIPLFVLEKDREFSEIDRQTLIQEGATGIIHVDSVHPESFKRQFRQIMEEQYMEMKSHEFTGKGCVIDFNTRQEFDDSKSKVAKIAFYDLKKNRAVGVEAREDILADSEKPNVRFDDVIGAQDAKEELKYFVEYLKNPRRFIIGNRRAPRGVLLYGPPGTGKTMLAKAMACESDVTFIQTNATDFMNKYVGESEANIRRIFEKARRYAPAIIFIDEIDAIGKKRTGSEFNSTTEKMCNTLLSQMDGFTTQDPKRPVFVLAATNYGVGEEDGGVSMLDKALIDRFDSHIYVDLPKEDERNLFIVRTLEKEGISTITEETIKSIAERTTGLSLRIIGNIIEMAVRRAEKSNRSIVDDDMLTALEEYNYGERKEHSPEYYKKVAIHETGHAYISYISGDKPSYITIESRGNFGGYMQHANQERVTECTREDMINRIRTSLAGRAAEQVFFGEEQSLNVGASSDLKNATDLAWSLICTYGMDGQLIVLKKDEILRSSLAAEYIERINNLLATEMSNTVEIIENAMDKIQAIANVLEKENHLTGAQFEELMVKLTE